MRHDKNPCWGAYLEKYGILNEFRFQTNIDIRNKCTNIQAYRIINKTSDVFSSWKKYVKLVNKVNCVRVCLNEDVICWNSFYYYPHISKFGISIYLFSWLIRNVEFLYINLWL